MRRFSRVPLLHAVAAALLVVPQSMLPAPPATARRVVVTRVPPVYPELAKRMHLCGEVIVRVVILPDGTVSETHVESGHPLLRQAAEDAVHRWRFAAAPGPDPSEYIVAVAFEGK